MHLKSLFVYCLTILFFGETMIFARPLSGGHISGTEGHVIAYKKYPDSNKLKEACLFLQERISDGQLHPQGKSELCTLINCSGIL